METPAFCQHPGDLEGCRAALIQAWRRSLLTQHCVMAGLAAGWNQCRQVLVTGVQPSGSGGKAAKGVGTVVGLKRACEETILLGYPEGPTRKAASEIFFEAYHRLIRFMISKFDLADDTKPYADDVFQEVFVGLHRRLQKGVRLERASLATYVWRAATHACLRAVRSPKPTEQLTPDTQGKRMWPSPEQPRFITLAVIERWEQLDLLVAREWPDDLVNRVILAQKGLQGLLGDEEVTVKELRADWQRLAKISEGELVALHEQTAAQARILPAPGTLHLLARMINGKHAQPWQVAVLFAAGKGLDPKATRELLVRLAGLSENAIYVRISRIYAVIGRGKHGGLDDAAATS